MNTTVRPIVNTINRFTRALENPQDTVGLKKAFKRIQVMEGKVADAYSTNTRYSRGEGLLEARGLLREVAQNMADPKFKMEHGLEYVIKVARDIRNWLA